MAEVNSRQSVKNGQKIFRLLKSLGIADVKDVEIARQHMFETIHDPKRRAVIDQEIEEQREHFDNLELHIGYVYGSSEIPSHASHYSPKYIPGARLPHVWIEPKSTLTKFGSLPPAVDVSYVKQLNHEEITLRRYSSLDLCSFNAFTIIAGSKSWRALVQELDAIPRLPEINVVVLGEDFTLISGHRSDAWIEGCGFKAGGALLVRPDQHVLARLNASTTSDDLRKVIEQHLGWL